MITDLQKRSAQAIVNIFETSKPLGDYGKVTLLPGDSGHLTYGRSQTTLSSGNLFLLVKVYSDAPNAQFGAALGAFLDRLEDIDLSLDNDFTFRDLLGRAGDDPVMHDVQDSFFDRVYWQPAVASAAFIGNQTALGMAVVYDSRIHGSWHFMRDRTNQNHGSLGSLGEKKWINRYINTRRDWLANHSNHLLRKTVYRMNALKRLRNEKRWDLKLPFTVRGVLIDEAVLSGAPTRVSADVAEQRLLRLRNPFMQGADVLALQKTLQNAGISLDDDGVFGPATEAAVIAYQQREGLTPDGLVGPATRTRLTLDL